jgi:hypothetical protein
MHIKSSFHNKLIKLILVCTIGFIALWNVPHTNAGRYILSGVALLTLIALKPDWKNYFLKNKVVLLFFAYLIFHLIFLSSDFLEALKAFRAEWLKLILYWILGAGIGILITNKNNEKILLLFGLAFSVPSILHISLTIWQSFLLGSFAWGYLGISESHSDLSYAAFQASLLFTPIIFFSSSLKYRLISGAGLCICVFSVITAYSRGGILFTIAPLFLLLVLKLAGQFRHNKLPFKKIALVGVTLLASLFFAFQFINLNPNKNFHGTIERTKYGFMGENPLELNCKGISYIKEILEKEGIEVTPQTIDLLDPSVNGDAARVMTARGAIRLILTYPLGFDQSRESYKKAITKYCDQQPAMMLANAHNGWLNMSIAIGIPGAILYFLILLSFIKQAWQSSQNHLLASTALILNSALWIFRSVLDASLQDQMLESQVFIIAYLSAIIIHGSSKQNEV